MKKFELTQEFIIYHDKTLYRIKALFDFGNVKRGNLGGFVERETNLSQDGDAWVYGNAKVYGDAEVYGNAWVCGDARVCKLEDYIVFKNFWSSGRYFTWTRSNDMWKVGCFFGKGKDLIKKAYKDSKTSGKNYEKIVNYVESIK